MAVKFIAEMRGEPGISVRSRIVDRTKLYVPSATQPATNAPGIDRLSQPKVRRNHGLDIIKMDMPNPLEGRFDKRPSAKTRLASPARTSVGALSSGRLRTTSKTSPIDDGAGVPVAKTKVESGLTAVRRSLRDRDSPLRRGRRALSSGCLRVSAEDDGAPMTKAKSETAAGRTRESSAALWSRALSAPRVAMLPTMRAPCLSSRGGPQRAAGSLRHWRSRDPDPPQGPDPPRLRDPRVPDPLPRRSSRAPPRMPCWSCRSWRRRRLPSRLVSVPPRSKSRI